MNNLFYIRRSLLSASVLAASLILWLSGSFWYDAYLQRVDAVQLLDAIDTEDLLVATARTLAAERQLIYEVLKSEDRTSFNDESKISVLRNASDSQFSMIGEQLQMVLREEQLAYRFTHKPEAIAKRLAEVGQHQVDLDELRQKTDQQIQLPYAVRDESLPLEMFDSFSTMISTILELRAGVRFIPRHNSLNVTILQDLRIASWRMSEAVSQDSTLLSALLENKALPLASMEKRLELLQAQTNSAWQDVNAYLDTIQTDALLIVPIETLGKVFQFEYSTVRRMLLSVMSNKTTSSITLKQWNELVHHPIQLLDNLDSETSMLTRRIGVAVKEHATRRLIYDSGLVLMCLLIGLANLGILRRIQHQATHDDLTDLPNRRNFELLLQSTLESNSIEARFAVMCIDLDGFKSVNDRLGHGMGDKLLVSVSHRLSAHAGRGTFLARIGGDEFAVLYRYGKDRLQTVAVAQGLINAMRKEFLIDGVTLHLGATIGISFYPGDGLSGEELLKNADIAMYQAKSDGKDRASCFSHEVAACYQHQIQVEVDLKHAIDAGEFELVYQPQVSAETELVTGVEALIRWNHPKRGIVSPGEFIPVAEDSGLMEPIGNWVVDEACRQMTEWRLAGIDHLRIAVNISAIQFGRPGFVEFIKWTCEQHSLPPKWLELEMTESVLLNDVNRVVKLFEQLRNLGIHLAMDDFGTGYSSLSYLQDLPLDTLKIDRSFIQRLDVGDYRQSMASNVVMLAKSCGLKTVAEGVETSDQLMKVRALDCDFIQGFYYSKPLSAEELPDYIRTMDQRSIHRNKAA